MKEPYEVTIGIALYNCEKYIERCLKSIINQTYKNLQIIIVNDGSTDNSLQIVEEIKQNNSERNICIYTKNNGGLSSARNYAIDKAEGEFVILMDADDWLEKNTVEEAVKMQEKYNCDIVKYHYHANRNERYNIKNKLVYKDRLVELKGKEEQLAQDIIKANITSYTWSMLIKKSIIKKKLYFVEKVYLEDKIFLLKLITNAKNIYFSSKPLYHYFVNDNGLMHKYSQEHYLSKNFEMDESVQQVIDEYYKGSRTLTNTNNGITAYSVERNLFNIYMLEKNKEKVLELYYKIKEKWKRFNKESNDSFIEKSLYTLEGTKYLKLWRNEQYEEIFKNYDLDIKKIQLKQSIKNILKI